MSPTNSEHENNVSRSRSASVSDNRSDSPAYLNDAGSEQSNKSRSPSPAHDSYVKSKDNVDNRIRSPSPPQDTHVESQVYGENQNKSPSPVHLLRSKSDSSRSPTPNDDRAKSQSRSVSKSPSPGRKSRSRTPRRPKSRIGKEIISLLFTIFTKF